MNDQVLDALEQVAVGSVAITARALAAAGTDLTFLQWRAVLVVGELDGGATVSEIATRIGGNLSPISRLISRLAARGLVKTAKDERDRRTTRVTLTEGGRALRSHVLARRRDDLRSVVDQAGLSDGDGETVRRLARSFGQFA